MEQIVCFIPLILRSLLSLFIFFFYKLLAAPRNTLKKNRQIRENRLSTHQTKWNETKKTPMEKEWKSQEEKKLDMSI